MKRFEREAQAAAKLHHTNIVPVHAIGQADGSRFIAPAAVMAHGDRGRGLHPGHAPAPDSSTRNCQDFFSCPGMYTIIP